MQYIVTAMSVLYKSSVNTLVDKELTRCAIMRIAIACTLVFRRCPVLVVHRSVMREGSRRSGGVVFVICVKYVFL